MEPFLGKRYKLKSSENFDEYLQFLEISAENRKTAASLVPICMLTRNNDGSYTFTVETPIQTKAVNFKHNEDFQNERPDGTKVTSRAIIDGNKLTYTEVEPNGRKSTHERVFTEDLMTVTSTGEGWSGKSVRTFTLV